MHVSRSTLTNASTRSRVIIAGVLAALLAVGTYLVSTVGMQALRSNGVSSSTVSGALPDFVYTAPETVPTTAAYGPVGPVSMVFAGNHVVSGLSAELDNPWIAISGQTGDYRALSAPHLPEPADGAVQVSADGTALAWAFADGVVIYDTVADASRKVGAGLAGDSLVGPFSPDGRQLAVYDGALQVLDVASGEVATTLGGVSENSARQAVWTPAGDALTYVEDGELVTHAWRSDVRTATPAPIADDAPLAWQPSGEQLATMREERGVNFVEVFDVTADGQLELARTVRPTGYAQQDLLGFTSDTGVAVIALRLESGPIEQVYDMSTIDDSSPTLMMQLPGEGPNWAGSGTLQVAAQPLRFGSTSYDEPRWPWSNLAKLVASTVFAVFVLGLYVTRPLRRRR